MPHTYGLAPTLPTKDAEPKLIGRLAQRAVASRQAVSTSHRAVSVREAVKSSRFASSRMSTVTDCPLPTLMCS